MDKMSEHDVSDQICEMLYDIEEITRICTFEEAGVMSYNKGIVIRYEDGTEFQVTVVQSK